ncbi:MAG: TonB family protein [Rhodocyclaceae bacterium]
MPAHASRTPVDRVFLTHRHWWILHALAIGVGASLAVHLVMGLLNFRVPEITLKRQQDRGLEIVLVNAKHAEAPKNPQVLAQANLNGGGTVDEKVRTTSPLPPERADKSGDALIEATRRQHRLETLQRQLMTQAKSQAQVASNPTTAEASPTEPTPTAEIAPLKGLDARELTRAMDRQQAIVDRALQAYAQRPRKTFIGANAREYPFAQYIEEWRTRIQRVGTLNYPANRAGRLYGSLMMSVEIKSDGTVLSSSITRSSGKKDLDTQALRIIQLASPFAPFPPAMRRDTDVLVITRTWTFARDTVAAE